MLVEQYVYFGIKSNSLSAGDVSERVGLAADEITIKGSRSREVPVPAAPSWRLVCRDKGRSVGEQAEQILARLRPFEAELSALSTLVDGDAPAARLVLEVVRSFGDAAGEHEEIEVLPDGGEKLPGQHQLLGWNLSHENLRFLAAIGASLDVDEHG